ncbi:ATP-dependent helicase [Lachnospiraceae bacterium LCP25S3_G4]
MSFNKAQSQAIAHKEGPMMVLAGPGSGKTLVITKRIEYLIRKHKVRPEEILVITFTKATSREMKSRFLQLVDNENLPVTFGTFHGIYYGILKWAYGLNAGNIFSDDDKYRLLKEVITQVDIEIEDEKEFLQGIAAEISNIKNNQLELENYNSLNCSETIFQEIYNTYERKRKTLKKIDFDDMLVLCYQLFIQRPDILEKWQTRFKYILIDEFQDINKVQYDVIKLLAAPENNLFIVGDDDQSIYQFRGARPEIMLGFGTEFPDAKQVILDVNYRSTKVIINGARSVIARNTKRYEKNIVTLNEQGPTIHIQEVRHPLEESQYVLQQIVRAKEQGMKASEIAILYRTSTEPRILAETLTEYGVPFQMKEHLPNLYDHFIGRNLQTYLRIALGSRERKDFLEIVNRPNRYIGRDSMEHSTITFEGLRSFYCDRDWMQDRIDQLELDMRNLKEMAPYAAIQYIRKRIGYDEYLKDYALKRRMQAADLFDIIEEIQERSKFFQTIEEWFLHIDTYTEELMKQYKNQVDNREAVTLLTMHGAKGLEYESVIIIAANEDITPYKKAKSNDELEEERRLFYVAMTRAKRQLVITYTKERNGKDMNPSRFVNDLLLRI